LQNLSTLYVWPQGSQYITDHGEIWRDMPKLVAIGEGVNKLILSPKPVTIAFVTARRSVNAIFAIACCPSVGWLGPTVTHWLYMCTSQAGTYTVEVIIK